MTFTSTKDKNGRVLYWRVLGNGKKKRVSKKVASQKDEKTPKKASPKKEIAKKTTPKKTTPKKEIVKKTTPKKASPKKASPKKASPKKASTKKASPKKETRFLKLYHTIENLEPAPECAGSGHVIIPFIRKVIKTQKITGICDFKAAVQNQKLYRSAILMDFKGKPSSVYNTYIPVNFSEEIQRCKDSFILINLALINVLGEEGHSNLLIINKKKKEVERFEPHGEMKVYDDSIVNKEIQKTVLKHLKGYRFISPLDYCPKVGPQISKQLYTKKCKKGTGFCAVWSTLYGHLRVLETTLSREEIVDQMFVMLKIPYFIQKYLTYINKTMGR